MGVALDDVKGVEESIRRNHDDRQEFLNREHPAVEFIEQFRKHKILIGRHFPHMDNYIRVSLGIPEEMRAFWKTWDLLPWSNKFMHH